MVGATVRPVPGGLSRRVLAVAKGPEVWLENIRGGLAGRLETLTLSHSHISSRSLLGKMIAQVSGVPMFRE